MTIDPQKDAGPEIGPAIEVANLCKSYDGKPAVNDLNFSVARGDIVALLGGNGAGKTTTIAMLLGVLIPTAGDITVLGTDMRRNRHAVLPRMNFSSPYVGMPARLSVEENLIVYANLYGLSRVKDRVRAMAEELNLQDLLKVPLGKLSAGQKTRASLAKSLINEPELLLLDEPTASLDPDTADWVRSYFKAYRDRTGATILLASHNMTEVERICSQVIMMKDGRIADQGTPADLITRFGRQNLEEVFLDIARSPTAPFPDMEASP